MAGMLATLLGAIGCANQDITLRPPKHPEELVVPPIADAKFSNPPKYPEGTLNQGDPNRMPGSGGVPNMSAMNGMGGGGMGGMGGGMGGMGGGMGGMGGMGGGMGR